MIQDPKPGGGSLSLSLNAVRHLRSLREKEGNLESLMLRITVDGGGCSGFQYHFKLDHQHHPGDLIFKQDGVGVVVDGISFEFIKGSEIDFAEQLIGSSFVIQNPNASSGCGCGSSFSI